MAVYKSLPIPDESRWPHPDSPTAQTFVAVHAQHLLHQPAVTSIHAPRKVSLPAVIPVAAPALDKPLPLPPMPEAAMLSPDSCPLLADFDEDAHVSSDLPSPDIIEQAGEIPVLDAAGNSILFKSLYLSSTQQSERQKRTRRRVLVIFNCQEYLRTLTSSIPSPAALPAGTELIIIGCGAPSLIRMYAEATECLFPIYTDPSRRLHEKLGMACTLSLGRRSPEYIRHSLAVGMLKSFVQGVRRICEGDAFQAGDMRQAGGEFLFETYPGNSSHGGSQDHDDGDEEEDAVRVTWCHRMANTRDHTEIDVIRLILGLDLESSSEKDRTSSRSSSGKPTPPSKEEEDRDQRTFRYSLLVRRWASTITHAVTPNHGRSRSHGHHNNRLARTDDHFMLRPSAGRRLTMGGGRKISPDSSSATAVAKPEVPPK
ncbi:hypothetical protein VTN77DRAFT_8879 [Rasamsonia byssochlamydoides]|uniref:uncharacterized protein n=1 Tax=Rasamsonia byssochlamydoides TaxID=89139 RepID=UPI003742E070